MIAVLPITLGLVWGILCGLTPLRFRNSFSVLGSLLQFLLATWILLQTKDGTIFSTQAGGWALPYGISFRLDLTSALMIWISSFLVLGTHFYSLATTPKTEEYRFFQPVWHLLTVGVYGSFSTADLFNLYVWFEILLLASFILMVIGGRLPQLRSNISYVLLNLLGSAVFLLGLGFLYNAAGTLNFVDLQTLPRTNPHIAITAVCLLIAFGLKAAVFPLFAWLPASYPNTPTAPLALFSGLLTKVGVYTLLRFFGSPSMLQFPGMNALILIVASLTMLVGVYGAAQEITMKRILSFHIVSQIGYMLLGIGMGSSLGLAACLFYLMHHMIVKTNLFLIAGAIEQVEGHSRLKALGGLASARPWIAVSFAVSALSLAGLPPLSGFWAKLSVLYSTVQADSHLSATAQTAAKVSLAIGLFVGLMTLYSMLKIWSEAFLKKQIAPHSVNITKKVPLRFWIPIAIFSLWTLSLGIYPHWLFALCEAAAKQLLGQQLGGSL